MTWTKDEEIISIHTTLRRIAARSYGGSTDLDSAALQVACFEIKQLRVKIEQLKILLENRSS